jgi:hypothetical protein
MIEDEYFKKWLEDKFEHLENKVEQVYAQTLQTNGRVNDLEDDVKILNTHKDKEDGMWRAYGRLATISGGIIGGIIAWLTNKFL